MENQFLELGMVIISEKLLHETYIRMHILMKCPFSSFSDLFLCSINYSFKGKDLVEVPMLPPMMGLGNGNSYPLSLSSVNGLGNLIPPSFVLNLSDRSFIFDN